MVRLRSLLVGLVVAIVLAVGGVANAASFVSSRILLGASAIASDRNTPPFVQETQQRRISARDQTVFDQEIAVDIAQGFGDGRASSRLNTFFSPSTIGIDAGVFGNDDFDSGEGSNGGGSASLFYEVVFEVDVETPYAFDIEIRNNDTLGFNTLADLRLIDETGTELFEQILELDDVIIAQETGLLGPGVYTLRLDMDADPGSEFSASSSVLVRGVIPEPGTGALSGLGLVVLASRRRRA